MTDEHEALIKFCSAQRNLTQLDDATYAQRRQHLRRVSTFRDMLREQMISANAACVPIMCGGKQKYAVLRQATTCSAVTCEAVMRFLRDLQYDATQTNACTIEDWVAHRLQKALTNTGATTNTSTATANDTTRRADAPSKRPTLSIVTKRPDVPVKQVHPVSMSRIQETVESLHSASEASKSLRKKDDERRKKLKAVTKEVESTVADHLLSHDPEHGMRRVRLVHENNQEATYHLRRKSTVRKSRPTVRTALPAIRHLLRTLREEAGIDAKPTWESYRWLTSTLTLSKVERLVDECLQRLNSEKTSTRVHLTSV